MIATPAREACGVFGIHAPGTDVARITFFALFALQHRGQESAGIATCDGRTAYVHKGMGLVTQVFNEQNLGPLEGHLAIGHTRYSTTGSSHVRNAQPYVIETIHGPVGLGHNGNLTNAAVLRRRLLEKGVGLMTASDSEAINQMLAAPPPGGEPHGPDWVARIRAFMQEAEGAYSLVVLTREAVFAVRDPLALRPLCIGELLGEDGATAGWMAASESCAFGPVGGRYVREVRPGEIVRMDESGVHSIEGVAPAQRPALCVFEYVYFARPDSIIGDQMVYGVRQRLGEILAEESPAAADIVVGVPDSARPAAVGYANVLGIPYSEGLIKNRYIGRTFIQPDERLRRSGARLKYNPVATLRGKRVVLIDDSIVRGVTMGPLVRLLRDGGAAEVHVRVSSPPVRHPCYMGVDMPTRKELIGAERDAEAIRRHVGADSLAYLSHEGMMRAVNDFRGGADPGHCSACFSGVYPLDVRGAQAEQESRKHAFEGIKG